LPGIGVAALEQVVHVLVHRQLDGICVAVRQRRPNVENYSHISVVGLTLFWLDFDLDRPLFALRIDMRAGASSEDEIEDSKGTRPTSTSANAERRNICRMNLLVSIMGSTPSDARPYTQTQAPLSTGRNRPAT
jgi:hypothetical protein